MQLSCRECDVGGVPHVIAVLPSHVSKDRALEEPSAVIMKLQSEYMQEEWLRRLRQSAAQMQSVALWHTRPVCLLEVIYQVSVVSEQCHLLYI